MIAVIAKIAVIARIAVIAVIAIIAITAVIALIAIIAIIAKIVPPPRAFLGQNAVLGAPPQARRPERLLRSETRRTRKERPPGLHGSKAFESLNARGKSY